ncbi:MAG: lysophospholipid acyltransferase family protein, partial [Oscillospiraceae bacterium]
FLERENPRQAVSALSDAAKLVEQGYSVIIFPEGTRAKSDTMGEFKAGAFKVASKSRARLVPVSIEGSWRIMEGNRNRIRPGEVRLTILPPISTAGLSREALRALPEQIKALLTAARRREI